MRTTKTFIMLAAAAYESSCFSRTSLKFVVACYKAPFLNHGIAGILPPKARHYSTYWKYRKFLRWRHVTVWHGAMKSLILEGTRSGLREWNPTVCSWTKPELLCKCAKLVTVVRSQIYRRQWCQAKKLCWVLGYKRESTLVSGGLS